MPIRSPDEAEYHFLTMPGAIVQVRVASSADRDAQLQVFGNRAGLLSLANVLVWMRANAYRREFLSFAELPFVKLEGSLSLFLRLTLANKTGRDGLLRRTDRGEQFEWNIAEDDLQRVAFNMHCLVSKPEHEYDLLNMDDDSAATIHVRMTDAGEWLR